MSWGKGLVLIVFMLHFVSIECIVRQFDCLLKVKGPYNGKISVTKSGSKCQRWDTNTPSDHKYKDIHFPLDGSRTAAENYCRNPDNSNYPWCYLASVAGKPKSWEYCNIPYCTKGTECTMTANGAEYLGKKAVATVGGVEVSCQRWDTQTPESHTFVDPNGEDFNEVTLKETENYCRNYKRDESGPWCYLTSEKRYQVCFTTPPLPICAITNICDAPPTVADATVLSFSPVSAAGPKYNHKTSATYQCNSGFEFADSYDGVECLLTKQWTAPPICNYKGSVKVLSLTIHGHTPQGGSRTQPVQFEGKTNEANCTASTFGPATPIFKWYIGKGRVLNISTARVYFSKYWQDMQGQYISTLFFKEMIPRESGNLTCRVELSPLSLNSEIISDTHSIPIAVLPKPVMIITPYKVTAKKGEKVTLECRSTYPYVQNIWKGLFKQIIWKRNNIALESKTTYSEKIRHEGVNSTKTNSTIVIANIQENVNYTCVGPNAAGVGEATSVVSVYSDGVSLCPAETHEGIPWSATVVGGSDFQRCMGGYIGMASRKCSKDANGYGWERPSLVHCVSYEMQDAYLESVDLAHGIDKSTVEASSARLRKITGEKTKLVAGELLTSVSIIENFVTAEEIRGSGTDLTEQNVIESASNILDLKYMSSWHDVQELYAGTALLMKQVDNYGRVVSGRHVQNKWRVVPSKNIVLQTKKAKATAMNLDAEIKRVVFPDSGLADMPTWANNEFTQLSVDVKAIYGDAEVGLCGLQYKTLNVLLPVDISQNTTSISTVNSDILALSITSERYTGRFDPPIRLKFKHREKNFSNANCNFWDFNANKTAEMRKNVGAWSTAGCKLVVAESHDGYTTCECDHLTNFAILMSPGKTMKTPVALKYMTLIGCGISLACLVVTVIIYAIYWKKLNSKRSVILLNLCVSLILALVTFLAGVERKENKHVCTAIAAMLHFFFLAVFSFMLMEGIELYILLVKVFTFGGGRKKWYILGGWGLPAVVVGISLGATQAKGYGNEDYCWLSLDNGLLWAFVVPALIIILINCVFLGMAIKTMLTTKSMEAKSKQNKAKHGVRGLCILMPLLGTTWVFGVLAFNNDTIVFQFIFTICNSLQGLFIFIFHSLMNQHLLKLWKEKRGRRASSSGSSSTNPMKTRIKQKDKTGKPRKASLSTDVMTLGWESGGSEFKPADPNLGVMNNPAFDDSDLNDSITHQTKPVDHNSIVFSVSY